MRRDEADAAVRKLFQTRVARRPAALFGAVDQRVAAGDDLAHFIAGAVALAPRATHVAQRHFLDEGDVQAAFHGVGDQVRDLVRVAAFHGHGIQFDALEAGRAGGVDAGLHLTQVAHAGDGAKALRIQAVEADVQALYAGVGQRPGQLHQLRAVGGHHQFAQAGQRGDLAAELDDALAHQRLAASEADLAGAVGHEQRGDPLDLLQGEHLLARQEGHVLGHAVHAAEVATVGDRQPQVLDAASVAVLQSAHGRSSGIGWPERLTVAITA